MHHPATEPQTHLDKRPEYPSVALAATSEPNDHEALLNDFLATQAEWEKYRTWRDDTTIANHEFLALRVEFTHESEPQETTWTIAAYESPLGPRIWHATANAATPVKIMRALLDELASDWAYAAGLWKHPSEQTIAEVTTPLTEAGWKQTVEGRRAMGVTPRRRDRRAVRCFRSARPGRLPADVDHLGRHQRRPPQLGHPRLPGHPRHSATTPRLRTRPRSLLRPADL